MARDADMVLQELLGHLPGGWAWDRDPAGGLAVLLSPAAEEIALIEGWLEALLAEADPRAATHLLEDWERLVGLPDACGPVPDLVELRRSAVHARLTQKTSPTPAFFIALAASYGATVTITEHRPHTCESSCEDPINDEAWAYAWTITGPETVVSDLTCEDACELPLRSWVTGPYECLIRRLSPAHTVPIFAYGS